MTNKAGKKAARISAVILAFTLIAVSGAAAYGEERELIPMGCTIGIQMQTDGIIVVGLSEVETEEGMVSPAGEAGVMPGDVIKMLGNVELTSAAHFVEETGKLGEADATLTIERMGSVIQLRVRPRLAGDGIYKLGLWLRDSVAGIGTVTFLDPVSGLYGALGHAISDIDTGILLPLATGSILGSQVVDVRRGAVGVPGELCGYFDREDTRGTIEKNTAQGIFGTMDVEDRYGQAVPIGHEDEIRIGPAKILANVSGTEIREFSIEITRIYKGAENTRNLTITVTDPDLLAITGGIVQGMSGSPIIQDGKLIGAVTHVLINDPTSGYGISIDNMLRSAQADDGRATLRAA